MLKNFGHFLWSWSHKTKKIQSATKRWEKNRFFVVACYFCCCLFVCLLFPGWLCSTFHVKRRQQQRKDNKQELPTFRVQHSLEARNGCSCVLVNARVCVRVCAWESVHVCVWARKRASPLSVCVCERERERERKCALYPSDATASPFLHITKADPYQPPHWSKKVSGLMH